MPTGESGLSVMVSQDPQGLARWDIRHQATVHALPTSGQAGWKPSPAICSAGLSLISAKGWDAVQGLEPGSP